MKLLIAPENTAAEALIPPAAPDGSGIGVNYADAYIKPLNVEIADGRKITCKRRGLKIVLTIGNVTGEAVMRRLDDGPDARNILRKALESAARQADAVFSVEDGVVYLEV